MTARYTTLRLIPPEYLGARGQLLEFSLPSTSTVVAFEGKSQGI